jgi:hypothetical protein
MLKLIAKALYPLYREIAALHEGSSAMRAVRLGDPDYLSLDKIRFTAPAAPTTPV